MLADGGCCVYEHLFFGVSMPLDDKSFFLCGVFSLRVFIANENLPHCVRIIAEVDPVYHFEGALF